jgi:hypothetical protein
MCMWMDLAHLQIQPNVCISLCSSVPVVSVLFTFLLQCKVGLISLLLFQHLCVCVCVCVCVCSYGFDPFGLSKKPSDFDK